VAPGDVTTSALPVAPLHSARALDHQVGVALAPGPRGKLSATGPWQLYSSDDHVVVNGTGRGVWTVEPRDEGTRLHISSSGQLAATRSAPLIARPMASDALVTWNGTPYRGSLEFWPTTAGVLVVNRLSVEEYLRGVVGLELGAVGPPERAAMEAQAVAARSYVYVRLDDPDRPAGGQRFDLLATVTDQVYGGVQAETPIGNEAVSATSGEVISYGGKVVNAPYFATCGGSTAEPSEVWREAPLPYLTRVSDRIPGTDRYYCDGSSHFRWSRSFTGSELSAVVNTYMRQYATPTMSLAGNAPVGIPGTGSLGSVRGVRVEALTPSGRVASLVVTTSKGTYHLRGNDIRFVLRLPHGAILNSTYFLIEDERVRDGVVTSLELRGRGNGHGVGMCQWGAIGRARAGQDYRTILNTYYPGTVLAHVD
jgi:stage II sporulation protein D